MMSKKYILKYSLLFFTLFSFLHCTEDKPTPPPNPPKEAVKVPRFDRDSAFHYVEKQVAFGPRVMNSAGHEACKNWLVQKFKQTGAEVIEQDFQAKAYTGTVLNGTNIIAQFNPSNEHRIVLAAHWDTRHIADFDPDESKQDQPILGADDGGSGVAVLLEVARQLQATPISLGVDIVLFDAEDYGDSEAENDNTSWCLGSQHWSRNLHRANYRPKFGILLDMVGARNARFTKDKTSMTFAPGIMNKVWKMAQNMGYGNYFVSAETGYLTDDHLFVNQIAKIPMIDIINRPQGSKTGFGHYWHTSGDDLSVIDARTLRAVGQTILAVVYNENNGNF